MAEFIKAFEEIDVDYSGEITREELLAYMHLKNYQEGFIEKWLRIFDADNSGTITLEEYCNTLGLKPRGEYLEQVEAKTSKTQKSEKVRRKERHSSSNSNNSASLRDTVDYDDLARQRLSSNLKIIQIDDGMSRDIEEFIILQAIKGQHEYDVEKDIAQFIKLKIDEFDGKFWHIVVGKHHYGSYLSHEKGRFIHFFVGRYSFLAWRTPEFY